MNVAQATWRRSPACESLFQRGAGHVAQVSDLRINFAAWRRSRGAGLRPAKDFYLSGVGSDSLVQQDAELPRFMLHFVLQRSEFAFERIQLVGQMQAR